MLAVSVVPSKCRVMSPAKSPRQSWCPCWPEPEPSPQPRKSTATELCDQATESSPALAHLGFLRITDAASGRTNPPLAT
jgi:hypothetical protein